MELVPKTFYANLKKSLRRRSYQRLRDETEETSRKRNVKVTRFRRGNNKSGFWKVKAVPKLRRIVKASSSSLNAPLKLWSKLKNGYMDMMIYIAGNVGYLNTQNLFGGKRVPKARQFPLVCSSSEAEAKLFFEIFKSLIASGELQAHLKSSKD